MEEGRNQDRQIERNTFNWTDKKTDKHIERSQTEWDSLICCTGKGRKTFTTFSQTWK